MRLINEKSNDSCICDPATSEGEFQNSVNSIPVEGYSPTIGGWITWLIVIQHKDRSLTKYWDLTET